MRRAGLMAAATAGLLMASAVGACGRPTDPLAPPAIAYGEDVCAECGMIVSEARFAAAIVVEAEPGVTEARVFDDIGEMLRHQARQPGLVVRRWYVHDYVSLDWLDATTATFVRAGGIETPMAFGVVAFRDPARARALADEAHGEVLTFDGLRTGEQSALSTVRMRPRQ